MLTHVLVYCAASRFSLAARAGCGCAAGHSSSQRCAMNEKVFSEGPYRPGHD